MSIEFDMKHFINIFDDCRDRYGMLMSNKCLKAKAKYLSFEFSSLRPRRRDISDCELTC